MRLTEICKLYFEVFSNKDIEGLSKLFSDEVILRDWEILANGKQEVLAANKNIFDSVDTIQVTLVHQSISTPYTVWADNKVFNEIVIDINGEETLLVVDVIEFDKDGLITKIEAYKG